MRSCTLAAFALITEIQTLMRIDCEVSRIQSSIAQDVWPDDTPCPADACLSASVAGLVAGTESGARRLFNRSNLDGIADTFSPYMCPCFYETYMCSCQRYRDINTFFAHAKAKNGGDPTGPVAVDVARAQAAAADARELLQMRLLLLKAERDYACKQCSGCCDSTARPLLLDAAAAKGPAAL